MAGVLRSTCPAGRLTLEITGVRVEQLQEITVEDIIAEGFTSTLREHDAVRDLMEKVRRAWDEINGKRGFGWIANPFVWVIDFRRFE